MDADSDNRIGIEPGGDCFGHLFGNAIFFVSNIGQDGSRCAGPGSIGEAGARLGCCDRPDMRTFATPYVDQYVRTNAHNFSLHDKIRFRSPYRYALGHR